MTVSPGTNFDDPRFRRGGSTPAQRLETGDYYVVDDEFSALIERVVRLLSLYEQVHPTDPDIAAYLLAQVFRQMGGGVDTRPPLRVDYRCSISIGDDSWINYGLIVLDVAPAVIRADVFIGPNCSLYTAIHPSEPGSHRAKWEFSAPITLEGNAWPGDSVVMYPGVTIGENSIIGVGAVITRDIPVNSIAVGNLARVIKNLDPTTPRAIETVGIGLITHTGDHA